MNKFTPSIDRVGEILSYDAETGLLTWKKTLGSRAKLGSTAGSLTKQGHLAVRLDGVLLSAHHLAWALAYGSFPEGLIQHRNGVRSDNRLQNLHKSSRKLIGASFLASEISAANVHDVFCCKDGVLYWGSTTTGSNRIEGRQAGYTSGDGYIKVEVGGKAYQAHRLVWLMHHGEWPAGEIDHINGIKCDNKIGNLRDVVRVTNSENRRAAAKGSQTGVLGVSVHTNGRFRARIRSGGKIHSLGLFDRLEDAGAAYIRAKRLLHAGCTI